MNLGLIIGIAVVLGAIAGGVIVVLINRSTQQSNAEMQAASWELPAGVAELLESIEFPAIIVNSSVRVVAASPAAAQFGLISQDRLAVPELVAVVEDLNRSAEPIVRQLEIPRGPFGDATSSIEARASKFGSRYSLLLVADRTEFRRLEEVRRDFVANISHELKTPIGAISLLAEALSEAADDPDLVRHFADRLSDESARLASITREIIELSRLQAEGALAKFSTVKIDKLLRKSVDANRVLASAKKIDIVVGGAEGVTVWGDFDRLVVAVNNLLSNAVQYSPENSRVGIGVADAEDRVEIVVTDQGPGMSNEEAERVFERFYRTDQARSRTTGGTGLGLSIVKHIVNHHGGDIRVWSLPGQGSSFTIRLPRNPAETD
ncbi:MAG: two-component sensor histidine kinase [Microbacteriaceae bacterium]|nr:two-component sensor histidine kinase [Microbacteriaceae bacterium]